MQTQKRLLLLIEEQSDQDLNCLKFILHFKEAFLCGKISLIKSDYSKFCGVQKFRKITVKTEGKQNHSNPRYLQSLSTKLSKKLL